MAKKRSFFRSTFRTFIVALAALTVTLGAHRIAQLYRTFQQDSATIRERYLHVYRENIRRDVQHVLEYIEFRRSQTELRICNTLANRVNEAHAIASHLVEENQDCMSQDELAVLVRESLRPIRFNKGRGYYFATAMNGIETLFADRPEMEGKDMLGLQDPHGRYVVRDMIELVQEKGEGFYSYHWTKPDAEGNDFRKLAFVKYFAPLDWFLGSGDYLDDTDTEIRREVLDWIRQIGHEESEYVFVSDSEERILSHGIKEYEGKRVCEIADSTVAAVHHQLVEASLAGDGYSEYDFSKPGSDGRVTKLTYVQAFEPWGWLVGTGVYLDDLDAVLASKRAELAMRVRKSIAHIIVLMAAIGGGLLLSFSRAHHRLRREFNLVTDFFKDAVDQQRGIDVKRLHFEEVKSLAISANQMLSSQRRAQHGLRKERDRAQNYLDIVGVMIVALDKHGRVMLVNRRGAEVLGYPDDQILGREWAGCFVPERHRDEVRELILGMMAEEIQDFEWTENLVLTRDGQERTIFWHNQLIRDDVGNVIGLLGAGEDVTEQKRAADEIARVNAELQASIQQARMMADEANAANASKSEFLANMSHEIRTPMNVILGFGELLATEELTDTQQEHVEIIRDAADSLLIIINDILDVSKIEAGKLETEVTACAPAELLDTIRTMMVPMAGEKGLAFEVTGAETLPPEIYTDPTRLRQCLVNLISNAIKFTETGKVSVRASMQHHADTSYMRFDVKDTGIGISDVQQKEIFEPFRQADGSTTRRFGGTGLGLSITRMLAEVLGGQVTVKSSVGVGSTFTLWIPARHDGCVEVRAGGTAARAGEDSAPEALTDATYQGRVLIVEDTASSRKLMETVCRKIGLETTLAEHGGQAVELGTTAEFDIVFMDVQMPVMNGYEATRALRAAGVTSPIIALTANAMPGDKTKSLQAGCDDHLSKPVNPEKLHEVLQQYLQGHAVGP